MTQVQAQGNPDFQMEFDLDMNFVILKHLGVVDRKTAIERSILLRDHSLYRQGLNRLVDVRNCIFDMNVQDIREFADILKQNRGLSSIHKEALIVDTLLNHGLFRVLVGMMSTTAIEFRIFKADSPTLAIDIKQWLDVPDEYQFPEFVDI